MSEEKNTKPGNNIFNIIYSNSLGRFILSYVLIAIMSLLFAGVNIHVEDLVYDSEEVASYDNSIMGISLPKGVYSVNISYAMAGDSVYGTVTCGMQDDGLTHSVDSNVVLLPSYSYNKEFPIYVNKYSEGIYINVNGAGEEQPVYVHQLIIHRNNVKSVFYLWWNCAIPLMLILYIIWFLLYLRNVCTDAVRRHNYFSIFVLLIISCMPLLLDYVPSGVDLQIHLNRLQGLADGLRQGQFPVRMHSEMWNGYGYPFGVFYGDLFYYLPAALVVLGLPLWRAYRLYLVLIILATEIIAYYSFERIIRIEGSKKTVTNLVSRYGGLFVTIAYTFSMWHLSVLYGRAAVGAYTAYTFIPLIILGTWELLTLSIEDRQVRIRVIMHLSLGFTGVAISHLLSLVIIGLFFALFMIMNVFTLLENRCRKLFLLLISGIVAISMSAGFLIPILHMSSIHDLYVSNFSFHLQQYGVYLSQLLMMDYNVVGLARPIPGVSEDWPQTMGLGLIIVSVISILMWIDKKEDRNNTVMVKTLALSALSVYMASIYFPYDKIQALMPHVYSILGRVQTSNRYLLASVVLLSVLFILVMVQLEDENKVRLMCVCVCLLTMIQGMSYLSKYTYEADQVAALSNDDAGVMSYSEDYLYLFNDVDYERVYQESNIGVTDGIDINEVCRDGKGFSVSLNSSDINGYIELPLFNYIGYEAEDESGEVLSVVDGDNHRVRVLIPSGYDGRLHIQYREPALWRIAECLSVFSLLGLIVAWLIVRRKLAR